MPEVLPKVTEVSLKILFLLIPGIIAVGLIKSVGPKRPRTDFESGLQIFVYGVVSYAIAGLLEGIYTWLAACPRPPFWTTLAGSAFGLATLNPQAGLGTGQIAFATLLAIVVGLSVAALQTHSVPHRVLRRLGLTKRTGEVDMWGFTFNSPDIDSWATVRHPSGKVYQGWVRGYSDGADEREIVLVDVRVYAAPADNPDQLIEVDAIPVLYLGLDRQNSVVEFQLLQ